MPWKVRVPLHVVDRIRGVVPSIAADVRERLALLAVKPRLGTPIRGGDFDGTMAYEFRISRLPVSRVFAVLYSFHPDEEHIDVLDFGVLDGSPPEFLPPSFERRPPPAE